MEESENDAQVSFVGIWKEKLVYVFGYHEKMSVFHRGREVEYFMSIEDEK